MPVGSGDVLVIRNVGQEIVRLNVFVVVAETLSVTRITKLNVPALVGVPEIIPALDSDSPPGSEPDERVQVYGVVPPVAAS